MSTVQPERKADRQNWGCGAYRLRLKVVRDNVGADLQKRQQRLCATAWVAGVAAQAGLELLKHLRHQGQGCAPGIHLTCELVSAHTHSEQGKKKV